MTGLASRPLAYIGLGGNLGDPAHTLQQGLTHLHAEPEIEVIQCSPFYRTKPVDATGPDFCNAVAKITTSLSAMQLLEKLLSTEQKFGRTRDSWHAPRTLDLDLLAYGELKLLSSQLTVPHPRAHERAFVLVPLCDIEPTLLIGGVDGGQAKTAAAWLGSISAEALSQVSPW